MSAAENPTFQETEAGRIPSDWQCNNLGGYLKLLTGAPFKSEHFSSNEGVPLIRIRDLLRGFSETGYTGDYEERYLANFGDVLVGMDGEFHVVRWKGAQSLLNQRVLKISAVPEVSDESFLFFLVAGAIGKIQDGISATTVKHLSTKDLQNLVTAMPPLPEQQKIGAILTAVDDKLDVISRQIEVTKTLKQGLMQTLFSRGVGIQDADGRWVRHTEFKESELGKVPVAWSVNQLDRHVSKVGSGVTPKGGSNSYLSSGIPLIRSQNVLVGSLSLEDVVFIGEAQHKKMQNSALMPEDVLLNITGASIGRCAILPVDFQEGNVNQHVCIIRTLASLNPYFLCHYLNSDTGQKQVGKFQAGGNREGLNYQQIRSFDVPVPTPAEQEKIVQVLDAVDRKLDVLAGKQAHYQILKSGLMQKLLTGEWRVKLNADMAT